MEPILGNIPIKMSDASDFYLLIQDNEIRQEFLNLREIKSVEQAEIYIKDIVNNTSTKRFLKAIKVGFTEDSESWTSFNSILIGFIALHHTGHVDRFATGGFEQNISFAIAAKYRNKGIMTSSLKMLLQAMVEDKYNVVPALVKPKNIESQKVLTKCGFDKVRESPLGILYTKRLTMDEGEYKRVMDLV